MKQTTLHMLNFGSLANAKTTLQISLVVQIL